MSVEAVFELSSRDHRYVESIFKALEPDNVNPPEKVLIESTIVKTKSGSKYVFRVKTILNPRKFDSLRGTLDEVISLVEAIDNTLTILK